MDYRIFKRINENAGRYQLLDTLVINFSQKVRFLFLFILIFMWFRNNSHINMPQPWRLQHYNLCITKAKNQTFWCLWYVIHLLSTIIL
jgi:hypothetical protein